VLASAPAFFPAPSNLRNLDFRAASPDNASGFHCSALAADCPPDVGFAGFLVSSNAASFFFDLWPLSSAFFDDVAVASCVALALASSSLRSFLSLFLSFRAASSSSSVCSLSSPALLDFAASSPASTTFLSFLFFFSFFDFFDFLDSFSLSSPSCSAPECFRFLDLLGASVSTLSSALRASALASFLAAFAAAFTLSASSTCSVEASVSFCFLRAFTESQ
jgi:hypothetical protein